jgi:hypothetical protein
MSFLNNYTIGVKHQFQAIGAAAFRLYGRSWCIDGAKQR